MAKVIMTIAPEDGMFFENINSFETENYIGIWDRVRDEFMLLDKTASYFEPYYLDGDYKDLRELDEAVYEECEEHITEVFDTSEYKIKLV